MLAMIYRSRLGRLDAAALHQEVARQERVRRRDVRKQPDDRREQQFDLPEIPRPKERWETLDQERPRPKRRQDEAEERSGKTFVIVSGLPRSGTSLMMQMLSAGGLPAMTDGERVADDDNPEGYFEWEAIKQIQKRPELLDEEGLDGKAIKVISMLLTSLPSKHDYRVVFMMRPVAEIAASQAKMIERLGTDGASLGVEQLQAQLTRHRDQTVRWLRSAKNVQTLPLDYTELVKDPRTMSDRVVQFLGEDLLPDCELMTRAVRPELYRQRQPDPQGNDSASA